MRAASLLLLLLPLAASAQDPARGRALYQTYCGGCHYERIHDERLRPAVHDLADLRDMVAQWAPQTKRRFTPAELEDIVEYLNESHYRFGLAPLPGRPARTTR
jgi:mono/diheme cytochrome c family protein